MRRGLTIAASLTAIVLLCGASPDKAPEEVATHVQKLADACKQVGGTPLPDAFAEHGILADELEFWAINEGAFQCDGCGELDFRIRRLASRRISALPNAHAKQVFAHGAQGMTCRALREIR